MVRITLDELNRSLPGEPFHLTINHRRSSMILHQGVLYTLEEWLEIVETIIDMMEETQGV